MTTNAYLYRMPCGIPGDVTRREVAKIEAAIMDPDTPAEEYGIPVQRVSGKIQPLSSDSDTIVGLLVRPYPVHTDTNEALGSATPSTTLPCDLLKSGYMTVKSTAGTPALDGQVYYNNTTGKIEAVTGITQTSITGCKFMGTADDDGNVEVVYNI